MSPLLLAAPLQLVVCALFAVGGREASSRTLCPELAYVIVQTSRGRVHLGRGPLGKWVDANFFNIFSCHANTGSLNLTTLALKLSLDSEP